MTGAKPRARARRLLRSDVSAAPLRLERSARAALGPLQGHRRAAAGALRRRPRSERDDESLRRTPGARRSHDRAAAHAWRAASRRSIAALPAADVDPEARERLAALGYVGSFVASASDPRTGRADPKDKIGLFNKLGRRDRAVEGSRATTPTRPSRKVIALLTEVIRRGSAGHRRLVHARHAVPRARRARQRPSSTSSRRWR